MPARWSSRRSSAIGSRRRAPSRRSTRCAIRRAGRATPLLSPTSPLPVVSFGPNASLRDILNFIGTATGINVTYDSQYQDKAYTVRLEDVTLEQALQQIMQANQLFYKVLNPKTIIVVPDNAQKHAQYDDLVVRVFYISHADVSELAQVINTIMRIPTMPVQPTLLPNKTANTITVRATAPVVEVIERIIRANDKPRAEIIIDVQILEVNRKRAKELGLNLSNYSLGLTFSPEVAPPNTSGVIPPAAPPPFNLNTISQGISTSDFYLTVPTAVVKFLEQDTRTKLIAKPQLRGAEGTKLTLNLGDQIPVLSTVFGAAAAGGFASVPQSSFNYKDVGVNLEMTPRVTYEGEIVLDGFLVESSSLGPSISVAGQLVPSFSSRKVGTKLRLREGESTLLAGLLRDEQRKILTGFPGIIRLPILRSLFGQTSDEVTQSDIVMLLTPHIVRTHELTVEDLSAIFIGTQQNVGLGGPPPLIAPQPVEAPAPTPAPAPGAALTPAETIPGVPRTLANPPPGVPPLNPPKPAGTSPVPTLTPPGAVPPTGAPTVGPAPAAPAAPPTAPTAPPGAEASSGAAAGSECAAGCRYTGPQRDRGADHHHAARYGIQGGAGALYRARVDQQRIARLHAHADGHVQPERAPRPHGAGRDVHAAGRRDDQLHAAHRRPGGPGGHRDHAHGGSGRRIRRGTSRRAAVRRRRSRQLDDSGQRRREYARRGGRDAPVQSRHRDGAVTGQRRWRHSHGGTAERRSRTSVVAPFRRSPV